ncbi:hypothetical protein BO71DRAFT_102030 [Aspergillus ellipticus CBS 707.79]|uniref:Uncharacterized protein n=1 Tax=Aspergillus ellipticus CBS 707.79 TaxID=1448320 RepID=A0A319E284_9EURO|nr:hypothetical protein BO71DRAFT_102030 [Aspergillus ellipticus CBS 707.79]
MACGTFPIYLSTEVHVWVLQKTPMPLAGAAWLYNATLKYRAKRVGCTNTCMPCYFTSLLHTYLSVCLTGWLSAEGHGCCGCGLSCIPRVIVRCLGPRYIKYPRGWRSRSCNVVLYFGVLCWICIFCCCVPGSRHTHIHTQSID